MNDVEVVVVGGGATGVGVARDLAARGASVTLCERDGLGGGTSGRSHGVLHSGARYAVDDPEGAQECIAENRIVRDIAGACVAETGGLFVSLADDDPDYFERKRTACESAGIPVETLDGAAAREREPSLSSAVERALVVPDAVVSPARLVAATAESARQHGATIRTDAPVEAVHRDGSRVTGVTAAGERLDADHVVNAAGAWAGDLATMAGVDVEMAPTRGVMVAVDSPTPDTVCNRCRPADDGDIVVPHRQQAVLGTTSVAVDDPEGYPREDWEVERIREECAAMVPAVGDAAVSRTYWGVRPLPAADTEFDDGRDISRGFHMLDHADRDDRPGLTTIVGGKLTTHRLMAAAVGDHLAERYPIASEAPTDTEPLPAVEDPAELDLLVERYDAAGPADADVVGD
jgi:glycerol-3-phosphate dehydrogenase